MGREGCTRKYPDAFDSSKMRKPTMLPLIFPLGLIPLTKKSLVVFWKILTSMPMLLPVPGLSSPTATWGPSAATSDPKPQRKN